MKPAASPEPVARRSTVEGVADLLRGRIHRGDLGPGDRLPAERELATMLGVGRITLRGALAVLQQEGYLEARRGAAGGSFVTALDAPYRRWLQQVRRHRADLDDLMDYRQAVEQQAAALAATRARPADLRRMQAAVDALAGALGPEQFRAADAAFHAAMAAASRSPRLVAAVEQARGELFTPTDQLRYEALVDESRAEHQAIVDAVRARDAEAAGAAVATHLASTRRDLDRLLGRNRPK